MKILKFVPASIRSPKFIENFVLFRKHRILRNIIKTHVFFSGKLPWKWISGGHLSSELQDILWLEMFVKPAFLHFPWSSYIKMTVS